MRCCQKLFFGEKQKMNNTKGSKQIKDNSKNNLPKAKPVHRRSVYSLLGDVKRFLKSVFIKEIIVKEYVTIYKNKYPNKKKSKQTKMRVGQMACHVHCGETGLTCAWVSYFPKELDYKIYCPHEDDIGLCTTDDRCDFKREITNWDQKDYPEMFDDNEEE
jgi:hypothetical protein